MSKKYINILGLNISTLNYDKTLTYVSSSIRNNKKIYICVAAVHLVMECRRDKTLQKGVNRADIVTSDGMPLVWIARLLGHTTATRVYGPTLMKELCKLAQKSKFKIYILGGRISQAQKLIEALKKKYPEIKIVGFMETPQRVISKMDNSKIISLINRSGANIVIIGMGCPYQERWMIENRSKITSNVLIGVGAAFDFISGRVKQAPFWMQQSGLEWLFRLVKEPRRLWRRYLVYNTIFIFLCGKELFTHYFVSDEVNKKKNSLLKPTISVSS